MIPKTLILRYPENFKTENAPDAFLPRLLHTRPSAATLLSYNKEPGHLPTVVFSSPYDAVEDIVIEAELIGNEALVKRVWLKEAA